MELKSKWDSKSIHSLLVITVEQVIIKKITHILILLPIQRAVNIN